MIREYKKSDSSKILYVINDAAIRYKGIIPDNCWHEPYMSEQELVNEFNAELRMYGYHRNNKLIGVIGIQEVKDVILIRHAYTLTSYQGKGTGSELLKYLLKKNQNSHLLVGTWQDATWAIRFYEKFGFILHAKDQSTLLLKKYWKISSNQIKNSVVLERQLGSN
jgi:GNAT superfamily N-acetyltransferase